MLSENQEYILCVSKVSYDPSHNTSNNDSEIKLPLLAGEYLVINKGQIGGEYLIGEQLNGKKGLVDANSVEPVVINEKTINKVFTEIPKSK
jgi:hypothetical protein